MNSQTGETKPRAKQTQVNERAWTTREELGTKIPLASPSSHPFDRRPTSKSPAPVTSPTSSRDSSPSRRVRKSVVTPVTKRLPPRVQGETKSSVAAAATLISAPSGSATQRVFSSSNDGHGSPSTTKDAKSITGPQGDVDDALEQSSLPRRSSQQPDSPSTSAVVSKGKSSPAIRASGTEAPHGSHIASPVQSSQDQSFQNELTNKTLAPLQSHTSANVKVSRGGIASKLETVDEGDHSTSPRDKSREASKQPVIIGQHSASGAPQAPGQEVKNYASLPYGDGTDDKSDVRIDEKSRAQKLRRESSTQAVLSNVKKPLTGLVPAKVRASTDGSTKHMTVETETVSSIPQASAVPSTGERIGAVRGESGGAQSSKTSSETMRPKRERSRRFRKAPTVPSSASSKADIFEARVASAVEEDSSDSEETFVYESNPPEPRPRQNLHRSRTPSTTSLQSLADRRGVVKPIGSQDGRRTVRVKRSMKFASNSYASSGVDSESADRDHGTVRAHQHRPIHSDTHQHPNDPYRRGRGNGGFNLPWDQDSPFSQASKLHGAADLNSKQPTKAYSSGNTTPTHPKHSMKKGTGLYYDFEDGNADGEHSPLISSLRTPRTRQPRRGNESHLRHVEYYQDPPRRSVSRLTGWIVMVIPLMLIILCIVAFFLTAMKSLHGVRVLAIENVLASEQEIMLDLIVEATNPNFFSIAIDDLDVNVFAKSRYVGSDRFRRNHGLQSGRKPQSQDTTDQIAAAASENVSLLTTYLHSDGGVDEGTDPIDDPEGDPQTMLLGRIFHFDSSLVFDASPLWRQAVNASGEMRLPKPGNKTELGGTERWERVLEHPFDLIIRGILRYQIPLTGGFVRASIGASVAVRPEDGSDGTGSMRAVRIAPVTQI